MPRTLWIAVLPLVLVACTDLATSTDMVFDTQGTPGTTVTFAAIERDVLAAYCALPGCHADVQMPLLSAGHAYRAIVGEPSTAGLRYVVPGQPNSSYLYIKMTAGPGMQGAQMPYGGALLPQATLDAVRAWIQRGAPND